MKQYELTYIASGNLQETEVKSLQERVISSIAENGGTLNEVSSPMKKVLDYPIKKESVVFVNVINFLINPEKVDEMEKRLRTEAQIINLMLLIKVPHKVEEPRRRMPRPTISASEEIHKTPEKTKKVEIKEIEKKLEEILGE